MKWCRTFGKKMLEQKEHIAVITDEYGTLRGIVTMEDLIETMLGVEIVDEYDEAVDMQDMAREKWTATTATESRTRSSIVFFLFLRVF